jgi:hypothetical protein
VKINLFEKEDSIAVDTFRDFARVMGARIGNFLYAGRVHPHPSRTGHCCCSDSRDPGATVS